MLQREITINLATTGFFKAVVNVLISYTHNLFHVTILLNYYKMFFCKYKKYPFSFFGSLLARGTGDAAGVLHFSP